MQSDDSWHIFMKRFAASVVHITGQELDVKAASDTASSSIVEEELETLRTKYEELSDEVCGSVQLMMSH
jgi:diaphanous 1